MHWKVDDTDHKQLLQTERKVSLLTLKVSSTTLMPRVFSFMLAPDFFFLLSRELRRDFCTLTTMAFCLQHFSTLG